MRSTIKMHCVTLKSSKIIIHMKVHINNKHVQTYINLKNLTMSTHAMKSKIEVNLTVHLAVHC